MGTGWAFRCLGLRSRIWNRKPFISTWVCCRPASSIPIRNTRSWDVCCRAVGTWSLPIVVTHRLCSMTRCRRYPRTRGSSAASIEEHVMFCSSTSWWNGKLEWRVQHEAEKGVTHLHVSGTPPDDLETLRQGALARQLCHDDEIGVDYVFDVPLELAKRVVGFRHDESEPGPELEYFEIFESPRTSSEPAQEAPQEKGLEALVAISSRSAPPRSAPPLRSSVLRQR